MFGFLLAMIYLSFISLGLPDALLGAAWPSMYPLFGVPVSYMGMISMTISACTVVSSLMADRLINRFGTGKVTAFSTGLTAMAMMGFFLSNQFWMLLVFAVPYGLGAGCVDAALNNYVAVHYASRHMSWLHCMWGVGASIGPYIMGFALTVGQGWNMGYCYIGILQLALTAVLMFSLPRWKKTGAVDESKPAKSLSIPQILKIPGTKEVMIAFFCYCALESTAGLWASSFLVMEHGISEETAAALATLFYTGITVGRFASGFVTYKLNDKNMIRLGETIIAFGVLAMLLPFGEKSAMAGIVLLGLGCAPIYPCTIHSTPAHFGKDKSQAIIGVQMACAYFGSLFMPPLFGVLANNISAGILPYYVGILTLTMFLVMEKLNKIKA